MGGGSSSLPLYSFKPFRSEALDGLGCRWVLLSVELHFHQMLRGLFTRLQPLCPVLELFIRPSTAGHRRGLQGYLPQNKHCFVSPSAAPNIHHHHHVISLQAFHPWAPQTDGKS